MNVLNYCIDKGFIKDYPHWIKDNCHYLCIMGSTAYGVSNDMSDVDVYGFCIPPKEYLFPHLVGEIEGFGQKAPRFDQFQMHHVKDTDKNREYDFSVYNITKYFDLTMGCNPNMVDSIFVPANCILHITSVGQIVRDNRHEFLNKKAYHTYKGYAFAQMSKIENGANRSNPKRKETVDKFGYDVKFAYHLVRLMNQAEQILTEHDLDLQRNNEELKAIRRGEVPLDELKAKFFEKEKNLETVYTNSTLRHSPDVAKIKQILVNCLEHHYGSLEKAVVVEKNYSQMGEEIRKVLKSYGV